MTTELRLRLNALCPQAAPVHVGEHSAGLGPDEDPISECESDFGSTESSGFYANGSDDAESVADPEESACGGDDAHPASECELGFAANAKHINFLAELVRASQEYRLKQLCSGGALQYSINQEFEQLDSSKPRHLKHETKKLRAVLKQWNTKGRSRNSAVKKLKRRAKRIAKRIAKSDKHRLTSPELDTLFYAGVSAYTGKGRKGVPTEEKVAVKFWKLAAKFGHRLANLALGQCHLLRPSWSQTVVGAHSDMADYFLAAAASESILGELSRGVFDPLPGTIGHSPQSAGELLRALANFQLSQCLEDPAEKLEALEEAAELGWPQAQFDLGQRLLEEQGEPEQGALMLFRAAFSGHFHASFALARSFAYGLFGLQRDDFLSLHCYRLCAESQLKDASRKAQIQSLVELARRA